MPSQPPGSPWSVGMLMRHYQARVQPCLADVPRGARAYQLQMAEYLGIDRTVLPYVIDDLVEAGLVERQADPADRRARKVVATERGAEVFRRLQAEVGAAENAVLRALDPAEPSPTANCDGEVRRCFFVTPCVHSHPGGWQTRKG